MGFVGQTVRFHSGSIEDIKMKVPFILIFLLSNFVFLTALAQTEKIDFDTICGDRVDLEPDKPAEYAFGRKDLIKTLNEYSLIPISKSRTEFPVRIKLLVCADGNFTIAETKLDDPYYESLKFETERIIKLLNGFIPAEKNGTPVPSYYWIQINYEPKKKVNSPDRIIKMK